MDVERLLDHVAERGLMALPAERTDRQIRVDALDAAGVERAVGLGGDAAERDALGGQRLLDAAPFRLARSRARVAASACSSALISRARHGDRTEAEDVRRDCADPRCRALAVAAQERVLRLRAGAVGSALRVTAEAAEGVGSARRARWTRRRCGV